MPDFSRKLDARDVAAICYLLGAPDGGSQREIARAFRVDPGTISRIKSGELWPDVEPMDKAGWDAYVAERKARRAPGRPTDWPTSWPWPIPAAFPCGCPTPEDYHTRKTAEALPAQERSGLGVSPFGCEHVLACDAAERMDGDGSWYTTLGLSNPYPA